MKANNKHLFYIFLFFIGTVFSTNTFAQKHFKKSHKEIQAYKTAYITQSLDLTVDQAEKFWPLYRQFEQERFQTKNKAFRNLVSEIKNKGGVDGLSESEAKEYVLQMNQIDQNIANLYQNFYSKIEEIISYKQIIKLREAEIKFNRKLLKKLKHKEVIEHKTN